MKEKNILYTIVIILFSIICGIFTKDYFLGTSVLCCGLLNAYYASIAKTYNYIFGALFCLLNAYVSYINGLYGIAILSIIVFFLLKYKVMLVGLKTKITIKKLVLEDLLL